MLSFGMYLTASNILDGEVNCSMLGSLKRRSLFKRTNSCPGQAFFSHEHRDVQKESWDLSGIVELYREQPFALEYTYSITAACLTEVIWEHDTFVSSPSQVFALINWLHVCGESTVASSVHWQIHPIHSKRDLRATLCVQRKKSQFRLMAGFLV